MDFPAFSQVRPYFPNPECDATPLSPVPKCTNRYNAPASRHQDPRQFFGPIQATGSNWWPPENTFRVSLVLSLIR